MKDILMSLAKKRKVFHSEADFQFALGLELSKKLNLENQIFFEKPLDESYIDIFFIHNNKKVGLELKYKTSSLIFKDQNEVFNLKNQSAADIGRFDALKDLARIETFIHKGFIDSGYTVFITNDKQYWENNVYNYESNDKKFRLEDKKTIQGHLKWGKNAKESTYGKKRMSGLIIKGKYEVNWVEYSNINEKNGLFKYLIFEVKRGI